MMTINVPTGVVPGVAPVPEGVSRLALYQSMGLLPNLQLGHTDACPTCLRPVPAMVGGMPGHDHGPAYISGGAAALGVLIVGYLLAKVIE